jgi:hypothetical protein
MGEILSHNIREPHSEISTKNIAPQGKAIQLVHSKMAQLAFGQLDVTLCLPHIHRSTSLGQPLGRNRLPVGSGDSTIDLSDLYDIPKSDRCDIRELDQPSVSPPF